MASAAAGFGAVLALATPALAHGGEAPDGTDYRSTVIGISPALPGVAVRVLEAGARLELVNNGQRAIEVLGYDGEPYLDVRPDGVYENVNSPATYLNVSLTGGEVPAHASSAAAPSWRKTSDRPRARWHDHRTHWMGTTPPPEVSADPGRRHRIRDWVVPLRHGTTTVEVRGTLDWIPPPTAGLWWAACLLGAAGIGALGLVSPSPRPAGYESAVLAGFRVLSGRTVLGGLGGLAIMGGLSAVGYAVAREIDAGSTGIGDILLGLLAGQLWPVLVGLAAIAAGGHILVRRPTPTQPTANFGLALTGVCLALFAGLTNASVLGRGVAPVPFAAGVARLAVTMVIAIGAGLATAGVLRLRVRP